MNSFHLRSSFEPAGDQPTAIKALTDGLNKGERNQVLLGVTGSGKTFTMANVIQNTDRPAIIMAPNKTLAAQLYEEMKSFFPDNAVEYFVSYYDYYQPEAYIPQTDTFIEKDAVINDHIDRLRHSATRSLLEKNDVIVVCSISCIYGLGDPVTYASMKETFEVGSHLSIEALALKLADLQYNRNDFQWARGRFRVRGDVVDIFPAHYQDVAWRIKFDGNTIEKIREIDVVNCAKLKDLPRVTLYANSHYVTPRPTIERAIKHINVELQDRLEFLYAAGKITEATRLQQRVKYDIEMMLEIGCCKGIEHYSRYLNGTEPGKSQPTLFDYLPKNSILFMDESHVSLPQVSGMYNGDRARKTSLVEYGFRLPSALDNRPLKFEEWDALRPQTIFVSATPGKLELSMCNTYVEQVIRPTGLVDPTIHIRPVDSQIDDLMQEARIVIDRGERVLVTALTKRSAENINEYFNDMGIKSEYLHSEVKTIDRIEIISKLRKGIIDVIVGVNLLREGLDIPECSLVGILDGDKEGFLRSEGSLLQTIGRAARNVNGQVIIYADVVTRSIENAIKETDNRRNKQLAYNAKHGITPRTIQKTILANLESRIFSQIREEIESTMTDSGEDINVVIDRLTKQMHDHAQDLEFEAASELKAKIEQLRKVYGCKVDK